VLLHLCRERGVIRKGPFLRREHRPSGEDEHEKAERLHHSSLQ
jgi:hypothetical protein